MIDEVTVRAHLLRQCLTLMALSAIVGGCPGRGPSGASNEDSVAPITRASLPPGAEAASGARITAAKLMQRTEALAHDSMLGRGPGQRGEMLATAYLAREMARIGLRAPASGAYLQPVPLQAASATGDLRFTTTSGRPIPFEQGREVIISAKTPGRQRLTAAPLVLVGHGIDAPEFRWNDYKQADLTGRIAVVLDMEPRTLSRRSYSPSQSTYHALWFLRARHALARGAAGVLIVRSGSDTTHAARARRIQLTATIGAAAPWAPGTPVMIHLSASGAERLARSVGDSLAGWRQRADDSMFTPVPLPVTLHADFGVRSTPFTSHNVVGVIPGSDPRRRDECVVYVSHWDGYGIGPAVKGDSIYNGALDDAAGVSVMLAIAEAYRALPRAPARTIVFLATTAEESLMLGADAYIADPVCPMEKTKLVVGMDWTWTWGRTDTIASNGFGYSTVDSAAAGIARELGKHFVPGWSSYWMASDHAAFLARGVPSWFGGLDGEVIGKPRGWALEQLAKTQTHVPSDENFPTWDMSGAVEEAQFLFRLGVHAAERRSGFRWTSDSEFARAASRQGGKPMAVMTAGH